MDTSFEDQIRERAYHIWLADGMTDGMAHEHWACAEQAVLGAKAVPAEAAEPVVIIATAEPKPAKARKAGAKPTLAKAKPATRKKTNATTAAAAL